MNKEKKAMMQAMNVSFLAFKQGCYADIHRGFLGSQKPSLLPKQVALHVERENMSEDEKKLFLGAAQILHEFDHPNIVKCLGIAMDYEPVIVVTEYMTGICMFITNIQIYAIIATC